GLVLDGGTLRGDACEPPGRIEAHLEAATPQVSGMLKSASASSQTAPQRPCSKPARTPIAELQDPDRTTGNRPTSTASRTAAASFMLTRAAEAAVSRNGPSRSTRSTVTPRARALNNSAAPASTKRCAPLL